MRKTRIAAAVVGAAVTTVAAAGIAIAGPTPTGNYQMCGYVYSNGTESTVHDLHNTALPGDPAAPADTMLAGYKITGKINGTSNTYTGTSNASGGYCMQGDVIMAGLITGGGTVSITEVRDASNNLVSFDTYHASINATTFNDHRTSLTSATGFHVKVS